MILRLKFSLDVKKRFSSKKYNNMSIPDMSPEQPLSKKIIQESNLPNTVRSISYYYILIFIFLFTILNITKYTIYGIFFFKKIK